MAKIIVEIPDEYNEVFKQKVINSLKLYEIINNTKPVPDNPTNKDIINFIFPKTDILVNMRKDNKLISFTVNADWLDKPYCQVDRYKNDN